MFTSKNVYLRDIENRFVLVFQSDLASNILTIFLTDLIFLSQSCGDPAGRTTFKPQNGCFPPSKRVPSPPQAGKFEGYMVFFLVFLRFFV